jgi:hypothetical protein
MANVAVDGGMKTSDVCVVEADAMLGNCAVIDIPAEWLVAVQYLVAMTWSR